MTTNLLEAIPKTDRQNYITALQNYLKNLTLAKVEQHFQQNVAKYEKRKESLFHQTKFSIHKIASSSLSEMVPKKSMLNTIQIKLVTQKNAKIQQKQTTFNTYQRNPKWLGQVALQNCKIWEQSIRTMFANKSEPKFKQLSQFPSNMDQTHA